MILMQLKLLWIISSLCISRQKKINCQHHGRILPILFTNFDTFVRINSQNLSIASSLIVLNEVVSATQNTQQNWKYDNCRKIFVRFCLRFVHTFFKFTLIDLMWAIIKPKSVSIFLQKNSCCWFIMAIVWNMKAKICRSLKKMDESYDIHWHTLASLNHWKRLEKNQTNIFPSKNLTT